MKLSTQRLTQVRLLLVGLSVALLLTACGESPTATSVPTTTAPTTAATTSVATTAPATVATTAAPATTQASGGTVAATTPGGAAAFATPTDRRPRVTPFPNQNIPPIQELLNLIPDTGLPLVVFNDYKAFRDANGIPANLKFQDIVKNPSLLGGVSLETFLLHFTPSPVAQFNKVAKGEITPPGYDLWEIDHEASSFIAPTTLVIAKGSMNLNNLGKTLLDAKAQYSDWKGYDYFTFEKQAGNPIQKQWGEAFNQVMLMQERKIFNAAGESPPVQVSTDVLTKDAFLRSVIVNPRAALMLSAFGPTPTAVVASQDFAVVPAFTDASFDPKLSSDDRKKQLEIVNKAKLTKPYMASFAYTEKKGGVGTYMMSIYYEKPEDAKRVAPTLEALVRYGVAPKTKAVLSDYYDFVSVSVQENMVIFKLNSKPNKALNTLFFQKDLPIFWQQQ